MPRIADRPKNGGAAHEPIGAWFDAAMRPRSGAGFL